MPDPHDNTKMTGDTHLPEVESELPFDKASGADTPGVGETAPGRGNKKAGVLKDRDDETSDGYDSTRNSGEVPPAEK